MYLTVHVLSIQDGNMFLHSKLIFLDIFQSNDWLQVKRAGEIPQRRRPGLLLADLMKQQPYVIRGT